MRAGWTAEPVSLTIRDMPAAHDLEHEFAETLVAERGRADRPFPLKREVAAIADALLGLLFPQLSDRGTENALEVQARLTLVLHDLHSLLRPFVPEGEADMVVRRFASVLPELHERLHLDADAIVAGDPAAESLDEVIVAYPGFLAIAIHRLAHELRSRGAVSCPDCSRRWPIRAPASTSTRAPRSAGPSASTTGRASSSARRPSSATA